MHKPEPEPKNYSPFWVCLFVFLAIGVDSGLRFSALAKQRGQLSTAEADKEKNSKRLDQVIAQGQQIEQRLQALAIDLRLMGETNGLARQIVQEFQIQWAPQPQPQPPQPQPQPQPQPTPKS